MNKLIASSVNPEEISLTVKGAIIAIVPLIGLILKATGAEVADEDIRQITEHAGNIVVLLGTLASSGMMLFGTLRKIYNEIAKANPEQPSEPEQPETQGAQKSAARSRKKSRV